MGVALRPRFSQGRWTLRRVPTIFLPMSASVEKVSVAIGRDVLEWARERAEREGLSLSAVLTEAARLGRDAEERRARQEAAWTAFVDWATEGQGLPAAALEDAERELGGA